MNRPDIGGYLAVVSSGRAANVPAMTALVGPATWFVAPAERDAYQAAVAAAGGALGAGAAGLCRNRNAALKAAWREGLPCFELSDDLKKIDVVHIDAKGAKHVRPLPFVDAARTLREAARATRAKLAGGPPTANAFYFNPRAPVSTAAFIIGDLLYVEPCDLLFDEAFLVKEDYDYTLQHVRRFGRVARCNAVLAQFAHYSNAGGVVSYRTDAVEAEAVRLLKAKWPAYVRDNPRRAHEILLRFPRKPPAASRAAQA